MSGNTMDKCKDCAYFSWREHVPPSDQRPFGQHLDGYCSKIFPRGYVGAGKPGGNAWHGKMHCFQFEGAHEKGKEKGVI